MNVDWDRCQRQTDDSDKHGEKTQTTQKTQIDIDSKISGTSRAHNLLKIDGPWTMK